MRRLRFWLLLIPVLLLLGACFSQYERVTVTEETGFRGRAAYDPYFAAELLFEGLGLTLERPNSWEDLPPVEHTILLPQHSFRSRVPAERLLEWVRQGGHLVVAGVLGAEGTLDPDALEEAEEPEEERAAWEEPAEEVEEEKDPKAPRDPLLEPLGLELRTYDFAKSAPADEDGEPWQLEMDRGLHRVSIGQRVRVARKRPGTYLAPAPEGEDDHDHSLVRMAHGQGWVTVLSDMRFFTNEALGKEDHAAFSWDVLAPPQRVPEGLTIFVRGAYLPWYELVARHGWRVLVSGALALALFLWSRGSRFGPVESAAAPERRSLLEHVAASGEFLWRHRLGEVLLRSSREHVVREALRKDPLLARLPENQRIRHLAEKAEIAGGQLAVALQNKTVEDPAEFLRIVKTLEAVRRTHTGPPSQPSTRS